MSRAGDRRSPPAGRGRPRKTMGRLTMRLAVIIAVLAVTGFAAEGKEGEGEGGLTLWKWANFAVLAGAAVYFIAKNAGPFFDARSRQIRRDMAESEQIRQEAEARAAEVDRRLANLEAEIAALRSESQKEAEAESRRLEQATASEIAKIQAHAEQEIAAAGKAARTELKRYSAGLALQVAEEKIRARLTPETQDALVRTFAQQLAPPPPHAQTP